MSREELWQHYVAKNPVFARDGQVQLSARGLRKLFDTTWDAAWREARAESPAGFSPGFEQLRRTIFRENQPPVLVGLCGPARVGKSTVASFLVREFGYIPLKFAGPLKDMLAVLGLDEEQLEGGDKESPCAWLGGRTPRYAMQTLGTEWGRGLMHEDLWVHVWRRRAMRHLGEGHRLVVDDIRFPNELRAIQSLGGIAYRVVRSGHTPPVSEHASEHALDGIDLPEIDCASFSSQA